MDPEVLGARRIHFSQFVEVGKAYVIEFEDEREPIKWVAGRPTRPTVKTLVVNPETLGLTNGG